jgi:hypothetical protein
MSGMSVMLLLPLTVLLEPTSFGELASRVSADSGFALWLLANSFLAYFVVGLVCMSTMSFSFITTIVTLPIPIPQNLLNFLVTKYTSALTLQVLGNAKGSSPPCSHAPLAC